MNKTRAGLVVAAALMLSSGAQAYGGRWLVVVNRDTRTCYRTTRMPAGDNWRRLGIFNTFRQAGTWTWEHRGGICRFSPVFS